MKRIYIAIAAAVFSVAMGAIIVMSSAFASSVHFQGGSWM